MKREQQQPICQCLFGGVLSDGEEFAGTQYPCWRYHKTLDPVCVNNEKEDEECRQKGYDAPDSPVTANKQFINWYWDIEDMSANQLRVFAEDEFGVYLPEDASQDTLMCAVLKLSKYSPQNENRLVFMAHTIKMNYDSTLKEIERMASMTNSKDYLVEVTKEEFYE